MIGIIGGMGPWATADLMGKIAEETLGTRDQDHLSTIVFSMPSEIPDRTGFLDETSALNPGDAVAGMVVRLAELGVTVAGMPCNTLHHPRILEPILTAAAGRVHIVSIIDETVQSVRRVVPPGAAVGVLATLPTLRFELYAGPLRRAGFAVVHPSTELSHDVHRKAIYGPAGIKQTHGRVTDLAFETIRSAIDDLLASGASAVILGCTELPAFQSTIERDRPATLIIDPTRALARGLIRSFDASKLKPDASNLRWEPR